MEQSQPVHDQTARYAAPAPADNVDRALEFRALAEMIPALVFMTDSAGANVYVNAQFQRFCGVPASALMGDGWLSALHPDDRTRAAESWHRTWALGERYDVRYRFRRFDGEYRWHIVRGMPLKGADGGVVRWIGSCTDIDDLVASASFFDLAMAVPFRNAALERFAREAVLLKAQIDLSRDISWVADDNGTIISVNEAWHVSSLAPPIDVALGDLIAEGSYPSVVQAWEHCRRTREMLSIEADIHDRLAGGLRRAKVTALPVSVETGDRSETFWVGTIV